jgi:TRAP-type C4-dicarboxylate transport system permease small subunit
MKKIISIYNEVVKAIIAALLFATMVLVFGNVLLRYAFNSGLVVSEELSRIFFVWIVFLGAALVMAEHGHIGIDTIVRRVPRPLAKAMLIVSSLLILFCAALLVEGSYIQSVINLTVVTPALGLPMTIFYAAGLFFGVAAIVIVLADLWRALTQREAEIVLVQHGPEDAGEAEEAAKRLAGGAGSRLTGSESR